MYSKAIKCTLVLWCNFIVLRSTTCFGNLCGRLQVGDKKNIFMYVYICVYFCLHNPEDGHGSGRNMLLTTIQ